MKTNIQNVMAMFALVFLLLVGSAFATEQSAAAAQATQLQLHIDKALTVGVEVVLRVEASNQSADELQAILDELAALKSEIDVENTTVETVQAQRKEAMDLVKSFRESAKNLLDDSEKEEIKAKAQVKFEEKFKDRLEKMEELCGKVNEERFREFAEKQQQKALELGEELNVSMTPELEAKLAEVRAKIESCNISKEQVAQMRAKVRVEAEALKERRVEVVADIHADVLKHKADMLEQVLAAAAQNNVSTEELQNIQTKIVELLESYSENETTAEEFNTQAKALQQELARAYAAVAPQLNKVRLEVRLDNKDERIELRSETKAEWKDWTSERKETITKIKEGRMEIRTIVKDGVMKYELRERMKDGVLEQRLKIRADNSGSSNDNSSDDSDSNSDDDSNDDSDEDDSDDDNETEVEIEVEGGLQ